MSANNPLDPQLPGSLKAPMDNPTEKSPHANNDTILFKLPPELRNMIYEYVLGYSPSRIPRPLQNPRTPRALRAVVTRKHMLTDMLVDREPPILHVCRTVRAEARGIYYTGRRFIAMILPGDLPLFTKWAGWADLSRVDSVALYLLTKQPFDTKAIYSVVQALRKVNLPTGRLSGSLPIDVRTTAVAAGWNTRYVFHSYPIGPVFDLLVRFAVTHGWDEWTVHAWVSMARHHLDENTLIQFWKKLKDIDCDKRNHAWNQARKKKTTG
ncbi:hypothetical protein MBLNU457_4404t1 [Dothideomycetes sp. NU457]